MYKLEKGNNQVHATAIIHKGANIGENNFIGPFCIIYDGVTIGSNNVIQSHSTIGSPPEHRAAIKNNDYKGVIIGDNNRFNEYVTINSGAFTKTVIGNDCFVLRGVYIAHDCIIGNGVTLSSNALLGGHTKVDDFANLGLGCICHQFTFIGKGSMIGMGAIITKKKQILPYATYVGNPASYLKKNQHLINKYNISDEFLLNETQKYLNEFYRE